MSASIPSPTPPSHILVIGAGVFGISTVLSLLKRPQLPESTKITLLDASPSLPNPHGSSVDTSRIIRPDYASAPYARLMREAQHLWRQTSSSEAWGGEGRYTESGLVLAVTKGHRGDGEVYVKKALENVRSLAEGDPQIGGVKGKDGIQELHSEEDISRVMGGVISAGNWGYLNGGSGWADAEKSVAFAMRKLQKEGVDKGRLKILAGKNVKRLVFSDDGNDVRGAHLESGETVTADLTILATGAWSPTLIDLRGRAVATGQALTYIDITEEEQKALENLPVILFEDDGTFIIPPRDRLLKVARHGYGYRNPVKMPNPMPGKEHEEIEVSMPAHGATVPKEGQEVCRKTLKEMVKLQAGCQDREWCNTRVCWYCDTPSGDFIIAPHPQLQNLILATGGSGHGFKFFPVIGEKIADLVFDHIGLTSNTFDPELQHIWRWRSDDEICGRRDEDAQCEDGSRGGRRGMIWAEECTM